MHISEAARRSGLSAKTIRYYESIALIETAARGDNGYRDYSDIQLDTLCFLQRARATGFSLDECRQRLGLYRDTGRHSAHVKAMVLEKVARVDAQLRELRVMRGTLVAATAIEVCSEGSTPIAADLMTRARAPGN
ncbi:MerR family transcriptional regulator [Exilibacterium tricleocarpae]|uniref:MerR family transcriptional regulator n=1 Tax=Exilibacterium tricleocarpae TaxID=2591008 RepID=A0A545U3I2_9GAMM|nr:MerR family DNA-binding protein [Exilibacterium tricleocarpae]TQV84035.1 MerR family transcriptional regulator [Exilibacterium tricleocarpae]